MGYKENKEEKKKNTLSIEHVADELTYLLTYLLHGAESFLRS